MFNWYFYYKPNAEASDIETEKIISKLELANKKFISTEKLIEAFEADQNLSQQINEKFKNLPEKYIKSQSAKVYL